MPVRRLLLMGLLIPVGSPSLAVGGELLEIGRLLREAKYLETTIRDLNGAVAAYQQVVSTPDVEPETLVNAQLGIGRCYKRQGKLSDARKVFQTIVQECRRFPEAVAAARNSLEEINTADPAALMPADTLFYVELNDPGQRLDRIAGILKRSNLAQALAGSLHDQKFVLPLDAILNEYTLAELTKIEGFGAGVVQISRRQYLNLDEYSQFLAVLFPGTSEGIRAVIGAFSTQLRNAGTYNGAGLYLLPEEYGRICLAIRSDVILLGAPRQLVTDALDRYDGKLSESLARQQEFRLQRAARRRDSAILTYADVSRIVPIFRSAESNGGDFTQADAILGLDTVERVLGRVGLTEDQLTVEVSLMLDPSKRSPFFNFFRSAPVDRSIRQYIPQNAVAAVSVALADPIDKWQQFRSFAGVLYNVEHPEGGGQHPEQAISRLELLLDLKFADDLLSHVRSGTLVLTSGESSQGPPWAEIPQNLVLIVNAYDGPALQAKLDHLADSVARMRKKNEAATAVRSTIDLGLATGTAYDIPGTGTAITMARLNDVLLLAARSEPIRQCLEASRSQTSLVHLGRDHPLGHIPEEINKFGFVRVDWLFRQIAGRSHLERMPTQPIRPAVLYTTEQPNEISCRMEIHDLPKVISSSLALLLQGREGDPIGSAAALPGGSREGPTAP